MGWGEGLEEGQGSFKNLNEENQVMGLTNE